MFATRLPCIHVFTPSRVCYVSVPFAYSSQAVVPLRDHFSGAGGWRGARLHPPGDWCNMSFALFGGLIHRYIVCLFAPQPRGVDFDAWASFYFMRRVSIAGSARIRGPRLAPAGAGPCAVAYILTGKAGVATQWSVDAFR